MPVAMLTSREVQDYLRISRWTLARWIKEGVLFGVKVGHTWRVPLEEVERLQHGERPAAGR